MRTATNVQSIKPTSPSAVKHDVIVLLKNDHDAVKKLFTQFEKLAKKDDIKGKVKIANKICSELIAHTIAEEEIFYPGARAVTHDDDMLNEAVVEHDSSKDLIAQIQGMSPEDPMYDAKVKVLGEYINHHVDEEESEMFPMVRKVKELDLRALAAAFTTRKKKVMQQLCNIEGEIDPKQLRALIGTPSHQ